MSSTEREADGVPTAPAPKRATKKRTGLILGVTIGVTIFSIIFVKAMLDRDTTGPYPEESPEEFYAQAERIEVGTPVEDAIERIEIYSDIRRDGDRVLVRLEGGREGNDGSAIDDWIILELDEEGRVEQVSANK